MILIFLGATLLQGIRRVSASQWRLLVVLLMASVAARAQAPAWQTAVASNGFGNTAVKATAADANGNVYITGTFSSSLILGTIRLNANYGTEIFIAKWSQAANAFVWAQQVYPYGPFSTGGPLTSEATAIAVSGSSVYVAGSYSGAHIGFGSSTVVLNNTNTADPYNPPADIFVVKLTDAGTTSSFVWAQGAGGVFGDRATALAVDGANVFLAGSIGGPTAFFGNIVLNSGGMFVAKLVDAGGAGNFSWAQRGGGSARALAVNGPSVYVAGSFSGTAATFGSSALTSAGGTDAFVTKLTDTGTAGAFVWDQRAGGVGNEQATGIATNGANVYVAGEFASASAAFGPVTLTNNGGTDVFVAKLADAGPSAGFSWVQPAGGPANETAGGLALRGTSLFLAGASAGAGALFGTTTLTNAGSRDLFLARLDDAGSTGSFAWAQRAGGLGDDAAYAVAVGGSNVYVGGQVLPPASFGSLTLTNTSPFFSSACLASVSDATGLATRPTALLDGVAVSPNPAHGHITVQLPAVPGATQATFTLFDSLGRPVHTQRLGLAAAGTTAEVLLSGLAPGLYHLRVQAGAQQASRALVVE